MMLSDEKIQKMIVLKNSIGDIAERVRQQNQDLEDISKDILGEGISEELMTDIIIQETSKEIMSKVVDILYGR